MSSFHNKIYQSVNSTIRRFVDVDSLIKNEELQLWYGRFRQAGFFLLLLNLSYIGLYIGYKIVADFTVSSFLFGYFMSFVCSVSSFVHDMWERNQQEIRNILNQNTHLLKTVLDKGISFFVSCPYNISASQPSETRYNSSSQSVQPSVDLRQSVIENKTDYESDSDNDKPANDTSNSACIQLNGTDTPVITTNVSLDTSLLEYIAKKRDHDEDFMRRMGILDNQIKDVESRVTRNDIINANTVNSANIVELYEDELSDGDLSDLDSDVDQSTNIHEHVHDDDDDDDDDVSDNSNDNPINDDSSDDKKSNSAQ
jgi:hypothetical protein